MTDNAGAAAAWIVAIGGVLAAVLAWVRSMRKDHVDGAGVALAAERVERAAERAWAAAERVSARDDARLAADEIEALKHVAGANRDQIAELGRQLRALEKAMLAAGLPLPNGTPTSGTPPATPRKD